MENPFDRSAENLGNITGLEHVNLEIPDQGPASEFYLVGLGLTRDPYLFPGTNNMWVNVGRTSQFHLPTGEPLVLRGAVGLVSPDRAALLERLHAAKDKLKGTKFSFKEHNDYVEAHCPWGNEFRLHAPDLDRFGAINLGIPYVEFHVPAGTASGIAKFYREILGAKAKVAGNGGGKAAHISVGLKQELIFRETDQPLPEYDGHHIQVYVDDFGKPHKKLADLDLITEESDRCQYRFEDIVDLDSGKVLFTIEHEIRSMTHPLYLRPLVNRNPAQSNRTYSLSGDAWNPTLTQSLGPGNRIPDPLKAAKAPTIAKRRAARAQQTM
ncbi:MAG TPA: VOC family protein [Stellaceae bacterium]|nr:VOC family protein [Stellaceae bacterium]